MKVCRVYTGKGSELVPGTGGVQEKPSARTHADRLARSHKILCILSIFLAVIGTPALMQGTVAFARTLAAGETRTLLTTARGFGLFALSASPLVLAGYTWRRTQLLQDLLDADDDLRNLFGGN